MGIPVLAVLLLLPGWAVAQVQVQTIAYNGWDGAVELTNAETRLVVVPAIGRIMYYGFRDGGNILWEDPQHYGKMLPKDEAFKDSTGTFAWTNFGGDKVWPNQQSEFAAINGRSWPPDQWFDGAAHQSRLLADGVVITSPVSQYNGARSIRTIRLAGEGTRVDIGQQIVKVKPAAKAQLEPLRYTIWNVTQIMPPEMTLYPLNPHSMFAARYHPFSFSDTAEKNFSIAGDIGVFVPDAAINQKTGADSDRWLAGIVGDTVIAEFFRRDGTQRYPDNGLSAEVYTCPDYTELELLSPWVYLTQGQTLRFDIAWKLHRLPAAADTPQKRRDMAAAWAQRASADLY